MNIKKTEQENIILKEALKELQEKLERNTKEKHGSCEYCRHYVQHYIKGGFPAHTEEYLEINEGHCVRGIPLKKGGKKKPKPYESCPYFEIGTNKLRLC